MTSNTFVVVQRGMGSYTCDVRLKKAEPTVHSSVDTTVWSQLARWTWAPVLTAPSGMAEPVPTELPSPLRLAGTGCWELGKKQPNFCRIWDDVSIASVLHPNPSAAQRYKLPALRSSALLVHFCSDFSWIHEEISYDKLQQKYYCIFNSDSFYYLADKLSKTSSVFVQEGQRRKLPADFLDISVLS